MVMGGEHVSAKTGAGRGDPPHRALSLASVLLAACVLALVVVQRDPTPQMEERLSTKALSATELKKGESSIHKIDGATERAIDKIRARMMKSLDVDGGMGGKKGHESAKDRLRDKILKEQTAIASLKLSSSNLFAKWERERTIARDAQTKAVSLSEILKQDKTKLRMEKQRLARETHSLEKAEEAAPVHKGTLSGDSSRTDLQAYFAKLNEQDKVQEAAMHSRDAARGAHAHVQVHAQVHAHLEGKKKGGTVSLKGRPNVFDVLGPKTAEDRDEAAEGLKDTGAAANRLLLSAEAAREKVGTKGAGR